MVVRVWRMSMSSSATRRVAIRLQPARGSGSADGVLVLYWQLRVRGLYSKYCPPCTLPLCDHCVTPVWMNREQSARPLPSVFVLVLYSYSYRMTASRPRPRPDHASIVRVRYSSHMAHAIVHPATRLKRHWPISIDKIDVGCTTEP